MAKLGSWPSERYSISWITQRLANRAPQESYARKAPASVAKQIFNPIAGEIQTTTQQLLEERDNILVSVANIDLLNHLYEVDLSPSISYQVVQNSDGTETYEAPTVYATINGEEHEITQAYRNNIETLHYNAIPSRVEDGEISHVYEPIIEEVTVEELVNTVPNNPVIPSHLYVTISGNTNWDSRTNQNIYFCKVYIKGITRKRTKVTEAIPIRYNGTFKSINQWREVEEVFVSYLDSDALISIDVFPWLGDGLLDTRNLVISPDGEEKWRFININTHDFGNTFISEAFTTGDFDVIRAGVEAKDIEYEIELLDSTENNITFDAFTMKPNTDYMFGISGSNFYVFNTNVPYPEVKRMTGESPDVKMDFTADKWVFARGEEASLRTRILDFSKVPYRYRYKLEAPDLQEYHIEEDGSLVPTTVEAWNENTGWEEDDWKEKELRLTLTERGTYIISIECNYYDTNTGEDSFLITKYLLYVPYITPEVTLEMPDTITNIDDLSFDSDGKLWVKSNDEILLLDVFYDYFIADYDRNFLYLKEAYQSVRIEI